MGRKPKGDRTMTAAERMQQYRKRMGPDKIQSVKVKDKVRKSTKRTNLKKAHDQQPYKKLLLAESRRHGCAVPDSSTSTPDIPSKVSYFGAKASKSRSLNRAKIILPVDKNKRIEVLKSLFEHDIEATPRKARILSSWSNLKPRNIAGRPRALTTEVQEKLDRYLNRNDISYTLPGRNNQVYEGKENGQSTFASKKFMLWTYKELSELIKNEDDDDLKTVKFSTLFRYISSNKEFVGITKIPQTSCLCPLCDNIELLLTGINKSDLGNLFLPTTCHDLIEKYSCTPITDECIKGTCSDCPSLDDKLEDIRDIANISYYCWEAGVKYQEKKLKDATGSEVAPKLVQMIQTLKLHYFNKRTQSAKYKEHIQNLKDDEAVIHIDFSENYKNQNQNEIKAAYYGQGQFSLYKCCVYVKVDEKVVVKNLGIVTKENDHSGVVSYRLNEIILEKTLHDIGSRIKKIHFWSDGCASQFRSQFAFYFLNLYNRDLDIYWHFFEVNHDKGAVDGIGGTIKHRVDREVLAKRIVVKDSKDFAEHANRLLDHIEVLFVENVDTAVDTESRENAQYVKGTLKVHKVVRELDTANKKPQLQFYYNSNELTPFCTKSFELVERLFTEQEPLVREVPKQRKTTNKKQKKTTAKSAKKSVPAKAKLRVSEVYSDVESDTETGAIKDVDERVKLTEFWTSISPLAKETDVIGKWFAVAYKPTSNIKIQ